MKHDRIRLLSGGTVCTLPVGVVSLSVFRAYTAFYQERLCIFAEPDLSVCCLFGLFPIHAETGLFVYTGGFNHAANTTFKHFHEA